MLYCLFIIICLFMHVYCFFIIASWILCFCVSMLVRGNTLYSDNKHISDIFCDTYRFESTSNGFIRTVLRHWQLKMSRGVSSDQQYCGAVKWDSCNMIVHKNMHFDNSDLSCISIDTSQVGSSGRERHQRLLKQCCICCLLNRDCFAV